MLARVRSEGAQFLRLRLTGLALPAGARLFVSSRSRPEEFSGPYTHGANGEVWTAPLSGDELIVEYFAPSRASDDATAAPPFFVAAVSHIFRDAGREQAAMLEAAACNLDLPAEWREAAKSTALLQFPSNNAEFACSGVLINTANGGGRPYLFTANHCLSQAQEASAASVTFFFDSFSQTQHTSYGLELVATGLASDFTLLRLNAAPPGARLSGWTTETPPAGAAATGIHHPRRSYKRIAFGNVAAPACPPEIPAYFCERAAGVRWSSGVTEPGSSGSGLFVGPPSDPLLVGTLSGGLSSCENPAGLDFYGRFEVTFQAVGYFLTGRGCAYVPDAVEKLIGANGGAHGVRLSTPSDGSACPWTASSQTAWLRISSGESGTGGATITYSAEPNPDAKPRTGYLTVAGQLIRVTQAGTGGDCQREVAVASGNLYAGRSLAGDDCASTLIARAYADRYTLDAQAGQQVNLDVFAVGFRPLVALFAPDGTPLAVGPNGRTASAERPFITLAAAGKYTIEVTSLEESDTGSYSLKVSRICHCNQPTGQKEFGFEGGVGEFTLNAPPDCIWKVESAPDWVTISSGANGLGSGRVTFTVAAAPDYNYKRRGNINIRVQNPTDAQPTVSFGEIVQSAACRYEMAQGFIFTGVLGSNTMYGTMRTGTYCQWTMESHSPWLELTGPAAGSSGYGDVQFNFRADANPAPNSRVGHVTISGQRLSFEQPGIGADCRLSPITIGQSLNDHLRQECAPPTLGLPDGRRFGRYYAFSGLAGQRIAVTLDSPTERVGANLIGPDGKRLFSDSAVWSRMPDTGFITLPTTGQYIIAVVDHTLTTSGYEDRPLGAVDYRFTLGVSEVKGGDCVFDLPRREVWVAATGETGSVDLRQSAGAACSWAATSSAPWLKITAGEAGNGSGGVSFLAEPNTGGPRFAFLNVAGHHVKVVQPQAIPLGVVSAASYIRRVAERGLISVFGLNLADLTEAAPGLPLPFTLGNTRVYLAESSGWRFATALLFVSPTQINLTTYPHNHLCCHNFTVEVWRGETLAAVGTTELNFFAPALFAANSDGQGAAAAVVQRVKADGAQVYESILERDPDGRFAVKPIDLGPEGERVYLLLFGTGIAARRPWHTVTAEADGTPLEVTYAGPQSQFIGLDQINVLLPRTLVGKGEVGISISISGLKSNRVTIRLAGAN
jgi:uncharacterized protein (TIGR03437 family)